MITTDGHGQASLTLTLIPNGVSAARPCWSVVLATKSTKVAKIPREGRAPPDTARGDTRPPASAPLRETFNRGLQGLFLFLTMVTVVNN